MFAMLKVLDNGSEVYLECFTISSMCSLFVSPAKLKKLTWQTE